MKATSVAQTLALKLRDLTATSLHPGANRSKFAQCVMYIYIEVRDYPEGDIFPERYGLGVWSNARMPAEVCFGDLVCPVAPAGCNQAYPKASTKAPQEPSECKSPNVPLKRSQSGNGPPCEHGVPECLQRYPHKLKNSQEMNMVSSLAIKIDTEVNHSHK